ncbi:MAG: alpha/beta fold hydrolase [Vicinamibacterales bacterium]
MAALTIYRADAPIAALVLAHGAGAGQKSAWMVKAAQALADRGITCATFDFPYITAGRKVPDRAPVLEAHWRQMVNDAQAQIDGLPLFVGGKSMGGRIASHIAAKGVDDVRGVVLFGYPLHPPGQPEKRRDAHLPSIKEPMLFIQGSADTFGNEAEMRALMPALQKAELHVIEGGDHSFKVKGGAKAVAAAFEQVIDTAAGWIKGLRQP